MNSPFKPPASTILAELHNLQQQLAHEAQRDEMRWLRSVGSARIVWNRLSYDELVNSGGDTRKLSALVRERYAMPASEADKQVRIFLAQCGTWS